ncbi:MAG: pyridoxamine 5'-phosphate oxidase family protein [Mariniblastus sp.]
MGKTYEEITDKIAAWVEEQQLFFVSTAPLSGDGLINCSPKGLDSFRILDPHTVAYADYHGSGIETAAHLQENGRIVIMLCAFKGSPNIVRFYGTGKYHPLNSAGFEALKSNYNEAKILRGIVEVSVTRISDSCGYGVPKFDYVGQRDTLSKSAHTKGTDGLKKSRERNAESLDGLPGFRAD